MLYSMFVKLLERQRCQLKSKPFHKHSLKSLVITLDMVQKIWENCELSYSFPKSSKNPALRKVLWRLDAYSIS